MTNMSYCRFHNTVNDLEDCVDHIEDDLPEDEHDARARLVQLCKEIVSAEKAGWIPEHPEDWEAEQDDEEEEEQDSED